MRWVFEKSRQNPESVFFFFIIQAVGLISNVGECQLSSYKLPLKAEISKRRRTKLVTISKVF